MMHRTVVETGIGHASDALRRLCGEKRTATVFDGRVPGAAAAAHGIPGDCAALLDLSQLGPDIAGLADRLRAANPSVIVAIGGGTTIDAAKLAALACTDAALFAYAIRGAASRAVTLLPRTGRLGVRVVAVPTTAGTSSEVNAVAITTSWRGHRLVVGEPLRPSHAVLDGGMLTSLRATAMREAALEALLRVAGMATGGPRVPERAMDLALALVDAGSDDLDTPRARLRIAVLGAATQDAPVDMPFAMKHWYVANETSFAMRVRKIPATIAVVPAVWRRIDAGDPRWGDRAGLRRLWHPIARALDLPDSPADGITTLIRRWGLAAPERPDHADLERIARAAELAWGRTLPALRGLDRTDIAEVLHDGAWQARASTEPRSQARHAHRGRR